MPRGPIDSADGRESSFDAKNDQGNEFRGQSAKKLDSPPRGDIEDKQQDEAAERADSPSAARGPGEKKKEKKKKMRRCRTAESDGNHQKPVDGS